MKTVVSTISVTMRAMKLLISSFSVSSVSASERPLFASKDYSKTLLKPLTRRDQRSFCLYLIIESVLSYALELFLLTKGLPKAKYSGSVVSFSGVESS